MTLYDPADNRKTDTGSREFTLGMEPLKRGKQLPAVRHIESIPVIPHKIYGLLTLLPGRKLDPRRGRFEVNFQALEIMFSITMRISPASAYTTISSIMNSTSRSGALRFSSPCQSLYNAA